MIGIYLFALLGIHSMPPGPSPEDLRKALEFQYESKLLELRKELAKTQAELAELKKQSPQCSEPASGPRARRVSRKKEMRAHYQNALRLMADENWQEALIQLESFAQQYADSELADNAIYLMAEIYLQKGEIRLAQAELQRLLRQYPKSDRKLESQSHLRRIEDGQN